ncbi:MAG: hypothetical protein ACREL5_12115 [Gemmatimonadales bacterium]
MTSGARRADFFGLEANEYLADLDALAALRDRSDAERLVRGARALRGAALMAGLGTYARAAAGLEAIARQVRDHALAWEPHARDAWIEGLAALRALVSRAATWDAGDDRQALALAERFDRVLRGDAPPATQPAIPALTPGVRAFIARESALIAGSLEQASRALAPVPPAAALAAVLERMQSLRGLGAAAELSPLPELLDAMEVVTRTLLSDAPVPPGVAEIFADAAHALSAMARTIADAGRIVSPPELQPIARRLLDSYASERDVVMIDSLAPAGTSAIVRRGTAPSASSDGDPVPVEMVSVGDHLIAAADTVANAASASARDLRIFVLHRTLAAMPSRSATGRFLAPLVDALTAAIALGVADERPDAFAAMLRGSGRFLVESGSSADQDALIRRRDAIATSLGMVGIAARAARTTPGGTAVSPAEVGGGEGESDLCEVVPIETLAPDESDIVSIESLAPDESDVVSIESLAPDESDVVPIESLAPDSIRPVPPIPAVAPGEPTRLELAFVARRERERGNADDTATLSGLIGMEIVAMASLLYRGPSALARADEVRATLCGMLADVSLPLDTLRPHLDELLDLVPLARDAA